MISVVRRSHFLVALLLSAAASTPVAAQVLYGTVVGAVRDSSGAVVPGAALTLTNQQTNQVRQGASNTAGGYNFSNVLPGIYSVQVAAQGFQTYLQKEVQVTINTVTRVDVDLQLGQVSETLVVSGQAALLQTDKADVHVELQSKALTELPLGAYRSYQTLVNLVPGATPGQFQNSVNDTPQRSLNSNINGTRSNTNMVRLDGALNKMNVINTHTLYVPPVESIETVNVSTNSFDAEQGISGGAAITIVTKSGTNDLKGALFLINSNNGLQARNFFSQEPKAPKNIDTFFGGAAGGPIIKNKLFFFGDYEGLRERKNFSKIFAVAPADQRAGDFRAYNRIIYDPLTGAANGSGRTPFANNIIPLERQSSITRKMQSLVPLPNLPGTAANFFAGGTGFLDRDNYDAKINWNRTDKHTIWGKYSRMDAYVQCNPAFGEGGATGLCLGEKPGQADTVVQLSNIGHTWVLSPSLLLDGTVGYFRMVQEITGPKYGEHFGRDVLGIPGTNGPDIRYSGQPIFTITGYQALGDAGLGIANPAFRTDAGFTNATNLSWNKGSHSFRFGFELVRFQQNDWQANNIGSVKGNFTFTGGVTSLQGGASPDQSNAYADFLLGLPQTMSKDFQFYIPQTAREWQFGWYGQDRWQATQNLTLTLGLRYEYYPLFTRADQGAERYDPGTNKVLIGRRGGQPDTVGIDMGKGRLAPRIGLAYRLGTSTVIRSGYGITTDPSSTWSAMQRPYPVAFGSNFPGANAFTAFRPIEQGIPTIVGPNISSGIADIPADATTTYLDGGKFPRGYIQSWNLTVERKFPGNFVGSVGYVGTGSVRELKTRDINAGVPGLGTAGRPLFAKFGRTATTNLLAPAYSSQYHSLQAAINRSFSSGLFVKGSYTYAHAFDFATLFNVEGQTARNRASADFDRTHVLQMSWIYELPFGPRKSTAKGGVASALLRDWQVNGLFSAYTGTPFTVTASATSLNAPSNTQTADQVTAEVAKLGGIGAASAWFDTTAFRPVTQVRFGNSGRNILRGPGFGNVDLGLFRRFALTERYELQFRAEVFNTTNTPHFNNPASDASTAASFGKITTALPDQRVFRYSLRFGF